MKRLMLLVAALPVLFLAGCKKEKIDPLKPNVTWESNSNFETKELTPALDAKVTVTAPGKFQDLSLVLGIGQYYLLANQYISIGSNKGSSSSSAVMNLVSDDACVSFLRDLGMTAGAPLKNRDQVVLDLKKILEALTKGQVVDNNSSFSIEIRVTDQTGGTNSKTARFHYTAGPSITWAKNASFGEVDLDADAIESKIEILAPGKIEGLKVQLEDGADPAVTSKVKNRTTGSVTLIDLVGDAKVADGFKGFFPASADISGKDRALLDFGFMYDWKYDMSGASLNVFTITVTDQNGKETVEEVSFRKK